MFLPFRTLKSKGIPFVYKDGFGADKDANGK